MSVHTLSDGDVKVLSRIAGRETAAVDLLSRSQGQLLDFYFGTLTADEIRQSPEIGVKCSYQSLFGTSPTSTQSQVLTRRLSRLEEKGLIVCCRNPDSPRRHLAKLTQSGRDLLVKQGIQPMTTIITPKHMPTPVSNLPDWLDGYLNRTTISPLPQTGRN